jgi:hypothetical protein
MSEDTEESCPDRPDVVLPDLSKYRGVCPVCNGDNEGPQCEYCDGKGVVDFLTK